MAGADGRIEHKRIGSDTAGSHVYRAWGDMYRQSMAYREPGSASAGLFFMACSGKQSELEDALNRMVGNEAGQFGVGGARVTKVRKTPSWPRSWANFSLLSLYSHRNSGIHMGQLAYFGPT